MKDLKASENSKIIELFSKKDGWSSTCKKKKVCLVTCNLADEIIRLQQKNKDLEERIEKAINRLHRHIEIAEKQDYFCIGSDELLEILENKEV